MDHCKKLAAVGEVHFSLPRGQEAKLSAARGCGRPFRPSLRTAARLPAPRSAWLACLIASVLLPLAAKTPHATKFPAFDKKHTITPHRRSRRDVHKHTRPCRLRPRRRARRRPARNAARTRPRRRARPSRRGRPRRECAAAQHRGEFLGGLAPRRARKRPPAAAAAGPGARRPAPARRGPYLGPRTDAPAARLF